MTEEAVVAVDIGGTTLKGVVYRSDGPDSVGTEVARAELPTPVSDGVPAVVTAIARLIDGLILRTAERYTARAVGLIMPGTVDAEAGVALYSANIGWRDLPIRAEIADRVHLPVAIEHDVRAGGLAESRLGAAQGVDEALYLAIGTGIAGAPITSGAIVTGAGNRAGEIGHLVAVPDGEPCACGQRGCTETYASASALPRRYRSLGGTGTADDAQRVIALSLSGDPVAARVFDDAISALAQTLVGYAVLMDPALIVIGGGLALAGDRLLGPLAARMADGPDWRGHPELVPARFGADSQRVGAALVGWSAIG